MLRVGGRYVLAGLVNPDANVTIDANMLVKRWITMCGVHNYHPRHLIQALDFVMANRGRFPFKEIVDAKFALKDLDAAFKKAAERTVLRAAIGRVCRSNSGRAALSGLPTASRKTLTSSR
jgi:threonine dehydrogenase-like Zn-dependent dehydrogenase